MSQIIYHDAEDAAYSVSESRFCIHVVLSPTFHFALSTSVMLMLFMKSSGFISYSPSSEIKLNFLCLLLRFIFSVLSRSILLCWHAADAAVLTSHYALRHDSSDISPTISGEFWKGVK